MLKYGKNLYALDKNIRNILALVGFIFILINLEFQIINITHINSITLIIVTFLLFTATYDFCPLFLFFNINGDKRKLSTFINKLPYNDPDSVFIFNKEGDVVYKNTVAKKLFTSINKSSNFGEINIADIINTNSKETIIYKRNSNTYQVDFIGSKLDNISYCYTTDISEIISLNKEIEESQTEVIHTFGEIGETRSKETGYHVKRVALYSQLLGKLYGLPKKDCSLIKDASALHDIGKIGIPDKILNKPGKLTEDEFKIMKTHSELGYKMLKKSERPIFKISSTIAYEHHEKYDGSGYPRGLKGEEISIYARITAIADVFDALGSDRVYKKAWNIDKILALLKEEKAKHFDPELIDLFFENLDMFLEIRDQYNKKS